MKTLNYVLILLFTLGMVSCGSSGSSEPPADELAPVVNFESPSMDKANPTLLTSGATIEFIGSINDETELKSIVFSNLIMTKTVDDFVADFNMKLGAAKPESGELADLKEYPVDFSVETLSGALPNLYTLSCTVKDASDNKTTVDLYFALE